jgi:hypothetical protein
MTILEKNELLDSLSTHYNRVNYLKILAEEKNSSPDVIGQIERRKTRLKTEIDMLLKDLYADWIGDAAQLKKSVDNGNQGLNGCIANIEKDIGTAQQIVKALGYVDSVIELAGDLLK